MLVSLTIILWKLKPTAQSTFLFQGDVDYMYFYQRNDNFELWISSNDSYEVYTTPWDTRLNFQWPELLINGVEMQLALKDGVISNPLVFTREEIMAQIYGINTNDTNPVIEKLYKYTSSNSLIIYLLAISVVVAIISGRYELVKTLLGPRISRIIWRCGQILSRSSQEIPYINSQSSF